MNKVAILLVLYNDKHHIPLLINSIKNQTYTNYEIFAIECSNSGESLSLLKELFPKSKTFDHQGNLGFAAGNNFLANKAIEFGADFLFVLNSDMELSKNTLEVFVSYFEKSKNIGVVGSTLLVGETNIIQLFGVRANFKTQRKEFINSNRDLTSISLPMEEQVDFVNGGSTFLSKAVYEKVGLFNEDYFMYNDEIDFAERVKDAGFKTFITSKTYIRHHHNWSPTTNSSYYLMYYYMMRNRYLYFRQNDLSYNSFVDVLEIIIKFPFTLKWALKLADIKLVRFYYLGVLHGLLGRKGISKLNFSKHSSN